MRVVFHPGVSDDLDAILGWLKIERPEAVEPCWRDIGEAIGRISVWPEMAPAAAKPKNTRAHFAGAVAGRALVDLYTTPRPG